ncbi:MAG: SCO family protein [Ardenticatenaceae bacterium]|nr:SCO family protein [Ardenticatenaceae bacterium]
MQSKVLRLGLAAVAVVTLLAGASMLMAQPYTFHGSLINPPIPASDFILTDQHGQRFRLSDQTGHVVLLFFGYTSCPDVCPTPLTKFKQVHAQLGARADRVRFVFITVDPERDTVERMRNYVGAFDPAFVGLTGSTAELEAVWRAYGVYREKGGEEGASGYAVDHSTRIYLVDAQGRLRLTHPFGETADDLAQDTGHLVEEDARAGTARPAEPQPVSIEGASPVATLGQLRVQSAWVRPGGVGNVTAAFLTIVNTGDQADALTSTQSEVAETVEIHATQMEGDVMRMRPIARLEVPAGGQVQAAPGGLHFMLIGLTRSLEVGERIPLVLHFERGGDVVVEAEVIAQ